MGIPLHLFQQPECLSPLSLQSLVQLWFIILYLVLLQFFSICTCALNYAFVVEPIFVINMVGYEISDCLHSNSKHVIFKLGINQGLHCTRFAKAKRLRQTWRSESFLGSTTCAINLHCTHDFLLKTVSVRPPCANFYHIENVCDGQPLPHSFFYAPCVKHSTMQTIKLLISCAMPTLTQMI